MDDGARRDRQITRQTWSVEPMTMSNYPLGTVSQIEDANAALDRLGVAPGSLPLRVLSLVTMCERERADAAVIRETLSLAITALDEVTKAVRP